ncbi:MAG TPA: hypothetical protein VFJ64_06365 [Solirubrobacterales bacterium]|nr:hypothetical protein [Solirubrobacterales bacterium]
MGMFEMSADQVEKWRRQCLELVESRVNSEEVLAAAGFRQGGASANYVASKAQMGGLVYAGIKMMRKKRAGGLPDKVMLAVTPDKLYAFKLSVGRGYKLGDEVGLWERAGLRIGADASGGMTALTIESPADGEKATLVGISVKDDPVSQELIGVLQGTAAA